MELYAFGYGNGKQFPTSRWPDEGQPSYLATKRLPTPTSILRSGAIDILWASWCDLIRKAPHTTIVPT